MAEFVPPGEAWVGLCFFVDGGVLFGPFPSQGRVCREEGYPSLLRPVPPWLLLPGRGLCLFSWTGVVAEGSESRRVVPS